MRKPYKIEWLKSPANAQLCCLMCIIIVMSGIFSIRFNLLGLQLFAGWIIMFMLVTS